MAVAETSLVKKNHQIPVILNQKIAQKLIEKVAMTAIAESLAVSTSTVIQKLKEFQFKTDLTKLPTNMSWYGYSLKKGKMSFIAQDLDSLKILAILDGRTQATIRNHLLRYSRAVRNHIKVITMDMFSPYYDIAPPSLSHFQARAKLVHWTSLLQQDSRKLSDKRFYRSTFRMHLTNQEVVTKLLSYSQELKEHYKLYQLLLFHFQEKQADQFFGLIEETISSVNPVFQTVFRTFLKDKDKIVNAMELPYSNAKLEATNNLIKVIKRNAFGFRKMKRQNSHFHCLEQCKGLGIALCSLSPENKEETRKREDKNCPLSVLNGSAHYS